MRLLSVNTGLPREVISNGKTVLTGIFKTPVGGRMMVRRLNLDGDRQADLSVHGGADKAVYAYPVEHYTWWSRELPDADMPPGMFGENFTVEGLLEGTVYIGDRFRIGIAEVIATQPRLPCYKLGIKFRRDDMVKRFLASGRTGYYFSVQREGEVGAGDEIEQISRDATSVPIPEITRLYVTKQYTAADVESAERATGIEALPESWRSHLLRRIAERGKR